MLCIFVLGRCVKFNETLFCFASFPEGERYLRKVLASSCPYRNSA